MAGTPFSMARMVARAGPVAPSTFRGARRHRKLDGERRTEAERARDTDAPSVRRDDLLGDPEAETEPSHVTDRRAPLEPPEDPASIFRRDPSAAVAHGKARHFAGPHD